MKLFNEIRSINDIDGTCEQLTIGEVVDTNDPQQMGRIRVVCPYFGEGQDTIIADIPWATPISPLAGINESASRGRANDRTVGPVAYGMFNIPKVGSYVIVACIEGDPRFRIYLGAMHDQFLPHTLPHGRYTYNKNDPSEDKPAGPLSSTDDPIQPLYDSQTAAFTKTTESSPTTQSFTGPRLNFEYRTRAADNGVAGIISDFISSDEIIYTSNPDDQAEIFTEDDGNEIENTHGYHKSRVQEGAISGITKFVYDPQVYSWTTPGFHSVSMSDNSDNCRIRIRSTHGHQIIMDDTNERVYISTAGGKTWIEMDEKGNIDIYGERSISVHAEKDINFTAGDTFRVKAKNGIHLVASDGELRLHAGTDVHLNSTNDTFLTGSKNVHIKASGGVLNLNSSADTNILAAGNITQTGAKIDLNGPTAATATASNEAWWTNRVPEHEPWARTMTLPDKTDGDSGNTHIDASEYVYNDKNVGRMERGYDLLRNSKWHR